MQKYNEAWFGVVDTDNNDLLSLNELQNMMSSIGMDPNGAVAWMKHMDKDENEGITKQEFITSEHQFWYKAKGFR